LKYEKETCKSNKEYQKERKAFGIHIVDERVSQEASAPSTKMLMELDRA
jgi:hypothetical protein